MIEHPRGQNGNVSATHWPDHFAPMTWHRCLTSTCAARVDPWEHSHYCHAHRAVGEIDQARRREIARAIVTANREHIAC